MRTPGRKWFAVSPALTSPRRSPAASGLAVVRRGLPLLLAFILCPSGYADSSISPGPDPEPPGAVIATGAAEHKNLSDLSDIHHRRETETHLAFATAPAAHTPTHRPDESDAHERGLRARFDFFSNFGRYMPRIHCLRTASGDPDWPWIFALLLVNVSVIAAYLKIFLFWRKTYLAENPEDRNVKLMDMAHIFLWCAMAGYGLSTLMFFWPAYRLLLLALIVLSVWAWKFAWNPRELEVSLQARRLQRELQETLEARANELAEQVAVRTRELESARRAAEQADFSKSRFLANMSHEIRTPMTAILGYADLLRDESLDEARRREYVETIRRNGDHLMSIVNDVLDLSKIEAGGMTVERVKTDPQQIVAEVMSLMHVRAAAKGLFLNVEYLMPLPQTVWTDPVRLKQILLNLVGNAIKFTESGGVRVIVRMKEPVNTDVVSSEQLDAGEVPDRTTVSPDGAEAPRGGVDGSAEAEAARPDAGPVAAPVSHDRLDDLDRPRDWDPSDRLEGSHGEKPPEGVQTPEHADEPARDDSGQTPSAMLCVEVVDTGVGLAQEQIQKLFTPFTQGDESISRRFGGTGLGLVISRELARLLGGELTVRSTPGEGSSFCVSLDAGDVSNVPRMLNLREDSVLASIPRRKTESADPPGFTGRMLIADDGSDNRRLVGLLMRKAGFHVAFAENGREAVDLALRAADTSAPFDVILMDMQMPVMDGYEASRTLRGSGYTGRIIALTAHAMAEDREKCLNAGCDDFAAKPIRRDALLEVLSRQVCA